MYEDVILNRLGQLIEAGDRVLSTSKSPPPGAFQSASVDSRLFAEWQAGSLSLLQAVFGEEQSHFRLFKDKCVNPKYPDAASGQGVLKAARADVEGGFLKRLSALVSADLFADFLAMAEHLLDEGYKDPAAVMVGSVLEEHLSKLCQSNGIPIDITDTRGVRPKRAGTMNADLARAAVYSKLDQQNVTAWLALRNSAAHGKYGEYTQPQVTLMLQGVRDFLVRNPLH